MLKCTSTRYLKQICRPLSSLISTHNRRCNLFTRFQIAPFSTVAQQNVKLWQTDGVLRPVPTEELLKQALRELFPAEEMIFNGRKIHTLTMPNSNQPLEFDIFMPNLGLYIEYQDPHHYVSVWYCHRTLEEVKSTDDYKVKIIESKGNTIIQVPCWWDGRTDSLAATIKAVRPNLLQHINPRSSPIPTIAPDDLFRRNEVPGIGELMAPCFTTMKAVNNISFNSWWLGEKYDGMRCCWNPETRALYSRSGMEIPVPDDLKAQMPAEFIDGEIWSGRGRYTEVAKFNPSFKNPIIDWSSFRIVAFDVPNLQLRTAPFEERYNRLLSVVGPLHPFVIVAIRMQLQSKHHLEKFTEDILQAEGEGVILQQMKSMYENGRSQALSKIKPYKDAEALVIGADSKFLTLELPDGNYFKAPQPKQQDISGPLPKLNDVVTFRCKRFSNGTIPLYPRVQRVRVDMSWDDVVAKCKEEFNIKKFLANKQRWSGTRKDMRALFEEYARSNNFDPLIPENWYKVRRSSFHSIKGATRMIHTHFKGNVIDALLTLFPEIGLDKFEFQILPSGIWNEQRHIREYFTKVAEQNGFDPRIPENWYNLPAFKVKKLSSLARYYSYSTALLKAFPEVKFELDKFQHQDRFSQPSWPHGQSISPNAANVSRTSMRPLFEEYALNNNFDPLNPENWYKVRQNNIRLLKGVSQLLHTYFNGSVVDALLASFPEIGLDKFKFHKIPNNIWKTPQNITDYFIKIAEEHGFDPHKPENWYNFPFHKLKKLSSLIRYYSYPTALAKAFPAVKFELDKFQNQDRLAQWSQAASSTNSSQTWSGTSGVQDMRFLFEEYARNNDFDPLIPENWYKVRRSSIRTITGADQMLRTHFDGSIVDALLALFPEIGLDKFEFLILPRNFWSNDKNLRDYFTKVADHHGFDPYKPKNWYRFPFNRILACNLGR